MQHQKAGNPSTEEGGDAKVASGVVGKNCQATSYENHHPGFCITVFFCIRSWLQWNKGWS